MDNAKLTPFYKLTPDLVIDAVESQGWLSDYRILALNSYENRVYQVGIDEQEPIIAKFYRPERWSDDQILEEHQFCFELEAQELSVVAPLRNENGESLFSHNGYRFALYPRRGGRAPELGDPEHLYQLGVALGRIHSVGAAQDFKVRPALTVSVFGWQSREYLLANCIPDALKDAYSSLTQDLLERAESIVTELKDVSSIRVHGDCHSGNILWRDDLPHFVDFDDSRMAPAIQDIWMLLTGELYQQEQQLEDIIEGYEEFHQFNLRELHLIEPLRTLRMINHSAWLGRRWQDPAFPKAFPWFNTERYWGEHILELREQLFALQENRVPQLMGNR